MEQSIFLDILASLQKLFVAYIPAAILGCFIGYCIGINSTIYQIFRRIFQIPHSVPPIAILPIMLLLLPENEPAAIAVIFLGTLWTVIINTAIGMQHFHRQNRNFRTAIFHLFYSLKVGIWVAWLIVITIEMLIGQKGLGSLIWNAYKNGNNTVMIQGIIYTSVIGCLLDQFLDFVGYLLAQIVSNGKKSAD